MKAALMALAAALALAAGPARALNQWDPVFVGNAGLTLGVPTEKMGVLFGSIGMVPPSGAVGSLMLGLRPLGDASREIEIRASENPLSLSRGPDVKTEQARIWVFSGQLPAGRYEIVRAMICLGMTLRDLIPRRGGHLQCYGPNAPRPVPLVVQAGGTVYIGRWLMNTLRGEPPDPKLTWMAGHVFLVDAYAEDLPVFEAQRKGGTIPHAGGPVENPIPPLLTP